MPTFTDTNKLRVQHATTGELAVEVDVDTGNGDGSKLRFAIENNPNQDVIDISLRSSIVNIGTNSVGADPGSQVAFLSPVGDTSMAFTVYQPGDGITGDKTFRVGRNGDFHSQAHGLSSVYCSWKAIADTQPRFQITEDSGGGEHQWGPGSTTSPDTKLGRAQAGVLKLTNALQLNAGVASSSVPNNTLFKDTADGKLKFKDNGGTVQALY